MTAPDATLAAFEMTHYAAARALWESIPGIGLSEADEPAAIEQFLLRNPGTSLVALAGCELVGTILVGHDGRRGFVHHLAVAPQARRCGLGTRLVREGMARLSACGIRKCHLLVFESNAIGRAYWDAVGAEWRESLVIYSLAT